MPIKLALTLLLFFTTLSAEAQYRRALQDFYNQKSIVSGRFGRRLTLGGGLRFISGKVTLDYLGRDNNTGAYMDTSLQVPLRTKPSFALYIGSYFPVTTIGENGMIVVNTELMAAVANLTYDSISFLGSRDYAAEFSTYKFGALLSLEYRVGGDVTLSKGDGTMFTLAAGLNPCGVTSGDYNKIPPYKIIPFIKAELGFFAGMAVKVRGIMYFGNSGYEKNRTWNLTNTEGVGDYLETYIAGSNGAELGLVIMPFSVMWNRR